MVDTIASTEPTRTECVTSTPVASSTGSCARVAVMRSICGFMSALGRVALVNVIATGSVVPAPRWWQLWIDEALSGGRPGLDDLARVEAVRALEGSLLVGRVVERQVPVARALPALRTSTKPAIGAR